jgi:hypothetical protein
MGERSFMAAIPPGGEDISEDCESRNSGGPELGGGGNVSNFAVYFPAMQFSD